jgi:hypothetical protein
MLPRFVATSPISSSSKPCPLPFGSISLLPVALGRVKFLGGRLLTPDQLRGVEPMRARKYLWVDGKIPQWINFTVHAADAAYTYIEISICARLTADNASLYHQQEGNPPFHVLGPELPPGWVSIAKSSKFSLGWRST